MGVSIVLYYHITSHQTSYRLTRKKRFCSLTIIRWRLTRKSDNIYAMYFMAQHIVVSISNKGVSSRLYHRVLFVKARDRGYTVR